MASASFFRPFPTSSALTAISSIGDLTRHNVAVKVQEDFKDLGGDTLDKLDVYIAHCDAVVHLVGDMCGAAADEAQQSALVAKHSDLPSKLPPLGEALKSGVRLPYTQWEAWLALYHGKPLMIAKAKTAAPRGPTLCARRRLARGASGTSQTAQGFPSLSRQRVRKPGRTGEADRLHGDPRSAGRGLCREVRCESATSPKDSSGRWRSASQATRRSISTA